MAYAEQTLSSQQLRALRLWLLGDPDEAIAEALGLSSPHAAHLLVHSALERLRYRFVG